MQPASIDIVKHYRWNGSSNEDPRWYGVVIYWVGTQLYNTKYHIGYSYVEFNTEPLSSASAGRPDTPMTIGNPVEPGFIPTEEMIESFIRQEIASIQVLVQDGR